jgi:hypothetical protein
MIFATRMRRSLQAGVHPKVMRERLGYSSTKIALGTHSHAVAARKRTQRRRWLR